MDQAEVPFDNRLDFFAEGKVFSFLLVLAVELDELVQDALYELSLLVFAAALLIEQSCQRQSGIRPVGK